MTSLGSKTSVMRMLTLCFVTRLLTLLALVARAWSQGWLGMCTWPGLGDHMNRMHERIASLCCEHVLSIIMEDRPYTLICRDACICPLSEIARWLSLVHVLSSGACRRCGVIGWFSYHRGLRPTNSHIHWEPFHVCPPISPSACASPTGLQPAFATGAGTILLQPASIRTTAIRTSASINFHHTV